MDSFFENLHSIAVSDKSIVDFVNFCDKEHNQIERKRKGCDIYIFVSCLVALLKKDKSVDKRTGFFMAHCINYKGPFQPIFKLSKNIDYCFEFLQLLKEKRSK